MNNDGEDVRAYACRSCRVELATCGPDGEHCSRCAPRCDRCEEPLTADDLAENSQASYCELCADELAQPGAQ